MGTLHEIYQLKPRVITQSAILIIKKDMETSFLEKFPPNKSEEVNEWGIFSNTFVKKSNDGKVERHAMYACDRIIDFKAPGIYLTIQSGSKYGFNDGFIQGVKSIAPYLENTLFYVIWDRLISRFEIKNGVFSLQEAKNFNDWDYSFDKYLISNYIKFPQFIADFFVDQIVEMKLHYDDMIKEGDDPGILYETEEYEELLNKIRTYKKNISIEKMKNIESWLKEKLILQRIWEDQEYS
jgi:hypothetical protein